MHVARPLLFALAMLATPSAAWAHSGIEPVTAESKPEVVVPHHRARAATIALLDSQGHLDKAPSSADRGRRLAELIEVAKRRRNDLTELVDSDPAEFLRVALPADKRATLPAEAASLVEDDADETGDLEVLHVDHATPGSDFYLHFLNTPRGKFSLHFAGRPPSLRSGDRVRVRGKKLDQAIVLAAAAAPTPSLQIVAASALSGTLGAQNTLAILVNFSNAPTQPFTVATAQSVIFGTTSSYDYEASYQQTTLTGAVAGWFTIAETSASCNYTNIATQAKQAAAAAGYSLSSYSRFVYIFPTNTCGWWGLGTVGGYPSHAWIHTRYGFSVTVVAHEMGHNLGLYHSHSLDCGSASVATAGCTSSDYGDVFDVMGSSANNNAAHYNAFQKERLGWLNAGVSPPLTTVAAVPGTSTYTIAPLEDARNAVSRALKIPRSTACGASNEWLYVESRQPRGFDAYLSGTLNVPAGVLIHKVTNGNADSSFLLDMTPATASWMDAALVAGQSFTDPLTGVVIAPVSVGSSSSTVAVTFPPAACMRVAPTVTLTPSGTVYTSAGASTNYTVSVLNNDSCGCGASTFDLSAAVPAGWSASIARTASASPAAVVTGNLSIVAASSATAAFYPITVAAANTSAPAITGSAAGTLAIVAAPPPGTFTATTTTDRGTYAVPSKGSLNVQITTIVLNGGAAVSSAAVTTRVTNPAGVVTTFTKNTDGSGKAKVSYSLKTSSSRGAYQVTSTATKGGSSVTTTTSFVAQ
jgi:hypothetical protein